MNIAFLSTANIHRSLALFLIPLLIAYAVFSQAAQALNPPPDGGYNGGNTAEGQDALLSLSTGRYNTAIGLDSLKSNTVGLFNTAVGAHALMNQTRARHSTAVGKDALMNSTGSGNTALGANAGSGVSTATNVICIGTSGQNTDNSCFIGGIYSNVQPIVGTDPDSVTLTKSMTPRRRLPLVWSPKKWPRCTLIWWGAIPRGNPNRCAMSRSTRCYSMSS